MMSTETEMAQITDVDIELGRGVFPTLYIYLDYDGSSQCAMVQAATEVGPKLGKLLKVLGLSKMSELPGQYCRVVHTWHRVFSIGHPMKNEWVLLGEQDE